MAFTKRSPSNTVMSYNYYTFTYVPIYVNLGTKHQITFKARTYENALKRAKKHYSKFYVDHRLVYELKEDN